MTEQRRIDVLITQPPIINVALVEPRSELSVEMASVIVGPPGPPGGGGGIVQRRFAIAVAQADFVLPGNPINGICLFSLNGILQHEYVCLGNTVSIDPSAEAGDDIMITWWQHA